VKIEARGGIEGAELEIENTLVLKGKKLVGAVGAGSVARGDFTGHDSAGSYFVQYQS
jgi:hypothetical protein